MITTSEKERRETSSFFPPETTFKHLPNFVRIEPLQLNEDQLLAKRDILFLGRLHPIKAIDRLIQAYRLLTPDFKQHHRLLIAGQGDQEYTELLKDLAGSEPHVRFLGKIHGSQKSQVLTKARVLVLPSFSENYGNVVPEALAHFTPVITSTGTPWSHLEQVGCGWTVNNSPEDIAYAIQRILTKSDSEYIACAQESRRFVVENLNSQRKRDYISSVFTPSL